MAKFIEVTAMVGITSWDHESDMDVTEMVPERMLINADAILTISERSDGSYIVFQSGYEASAQRLSVKDGYKYLVRKLTESEQG